MSTNHTPAPWWPTDHGVRDRGGYIAHMNSVQRYEGQDERYAREVAQREADKLLIAAAPDLLEALEDMLAVHGVRCEHARADSSIPTSWVKLSDKARAAIAKATGQKGGA